MESAEICVHQWNILVNKFGHLITWDHLGILELKETEFEPDENGIWEISGRFFRDLDAFEKFRAID